MDPHARDIRSAKHARIVDRSAETFRRVPRRDLVLEGDARVVSALDGHGRVVDQMQVKILLGQSEEDAFAVQCCRNCRWPGRAQRSGL